MAHTVEIKEIINGVQITETIDADIVVKLISYQSKPFLRTTNETDEETYQVLDIVGEIYNTPALATDFRIIDANDNVFIPSNGVELIEYSKKIRAFRPDEDRDIFYIGNITTTANSLTINLPSDDVNWAFIDGSFYEKYYPDTFNFTPVTTGQKILIVYAKPDSQVFYLAQGAESTEAVEPDYGGLFVARIIVDSGGQIVEEEELNFKERAEDAWRNITIAEDGVFTLNMGNSLAASFSVNVLSGVATPTIGIIRQKAGKSFWDGSEFWIHNISNKDIILYPSDPTDTELWKEITFAETTIVKAESWAKLKIKYGELVLIEMGGGGGDLTLEQARQNGNVLEGNVELMLNNLYNGFEASHGDYQVYNGISDQGFPVFFRYNESEDLQETLSFTPDRLEIYTSYNSSLTFKGIIGSHEYNKQGDRMAFAQLSDVYDYYQLAEAPAKFTVTSSITNETLSTDDGLKQNNRNNLIANGVNAINITLTSTAEAKFQAIYHKLGSGTITFVAGAGVTIFLIDDTAVMTGTAGKQTASVHRDGSVYYIQISNR